MKFSLSCFFVLFALCIQSQNTVGLISYNASKTYDGYNLLFPHNQPDIFLLNNCGEIVHTWEGEPNSRPGNTAYLREDGRIVKTSRDGDITQDAIWRGGGGANIEIRDWDNNLEWSYSLNDSLFRLHHDIAIIEKGNNEFNILMIAWEAKNLGEVIAAGRDTSVLETDQLWPDFIREIDPASDEIVWEWHAWDHLVQERDSMLANYGVVAESPGKIDINYDFDGSGDPDWMHSNAIDFDPINNNILLSVPTFSEIWIIDHTTTTEQAATSFGGFGNRGGDLMFRWGNPQVYNNGTEEDRKLFYQHDPHFIDEFVEVFDPNFGRILLFNNRVTDSTSSVNSLNPGFDMYDWAYPFSDGTFGPDDFSFEFFYPDDTTRLHSTGLSSAQYLDNGNYLITVGRVGYSFEITPDNEIVWEYITPRIGMAPATQGDTLSINQNLTFRLKRYPPEYGAFEGRDLTPKGWIELEPNTTYCDQLIPTIDLFESLGLEIYPNPADNMITLEWEAGIYVDIEVYNLQGQQMLEPLRLSGGRKYLDTSSWVNGIYVVRVNQKDAGKFLIVR